ncbi:TonB-dependent receptor domain-containing protein [Flavilitoribacter nigricans]|uniref:Outer membrane protein beta-barrel domain-containing protein n=1 Tax=Flavilitoribacter nigricans (strain ATCC 23147 / DSM 23189 / NBRC 102662 / NCIMB 1420 / SS-2) TaxID=1122177 RepID=A0A2D0N5F9_FLAN2|nr:TonB-dependent receptor [Flavilitoribacter nigricans]PHN03628.1 hypothetical protein CRP01_25555 [Flavilitoribacter nigricans DSM 23189 = NBRC 102662]
MIRSIICGFLLLSASGLLAQLSVKGAVQDETGNGLPFVNILAYTAADSSFVKGFLTDEAGRFDVALPDGTYRLTISCLGMQEHELTVSQSMEIEPVQLQPVAAELEKVTVTASKPMVQRLQDRLVVNVEGSILSSGNNTLEILQKSPGVIVDQDGGISLNGRTGVRVYIDGKDTRLGGDQLAAILEGMPANAIERIDIITNPSAKYEAQGNAGIIDVITKKGKLFGTNGQINLSPGYGRYFRWDNNVSFNHRTEKMNLYGQYAFAKRNQYMEIIIDRIFLENGQPEAVIDMQTLFRLPIETHSPRLGLDYTLGEKTTLGVLVSGFANITGQDADNEILTRDGEGSFVQAQNTDMYTRTNWFQYTGNVNLRHEFANSSSLDVDVDYARYDNNSDERFASEFFNENGTSTLENALLGDVLGTLNLAGLSIDYSLPLSKQYTLETGWKNTLVKTDNDLTYYDEYDGNTTLNTGLSNRFIYREAIYAAYTNLNMSFGKWNGALGLRAEQTFIQGDQKTSEESFDNDYFNLFPSLSFNYVFNPKHTLGFNVSRRLNRPGYNDLNPFRFFVNNYTFRVGNPFLTPEFTWSAEVNYTHKQRYYFALNVGHTQSHLTRAIFQEENEDYVVVKPLNVRTLNSLGFTASLPVNIAPWWNSQWNINGSLNDFDGEIGGFRFNQLNPVVVFNTNHVLQLGKGYQLQLSGFYLPSHYGSISKIEDISQITLGLQKRILQNRGWLRLNFNDIFYNGYPAGRTVHGNIDDKFISKRDTRYVTFSFSYSFGKQTVKSQSRRRTGIENELDRARQSNN